MIIIPGLCSISFRQLKVEEIIELCGRSGIGAVEWGGDIHLPHGDLREAERLRGLCGRAQILCPSYGSYYRVGESEGAGLSFAAVLETAVVLGCETVRVWAGSRGPEEADKAYYNQVADDGRRIGDLAAERGMTVSFEYHNRSLTEDSASLSLLDKLIAHPAIRYYWQPPHGYSDRDCLDSLRALGPKLTNLHVFHWLLPGREGEEHDRRPLEEGSSRWRRFFQAASEMSRAGGEERYAFLEFFRDDDPDQMIRDADVLKELIGRT